MAKVIMMWAMLALALAALPAPTMQQAAAPAPPAPTVQQAAAPAPAPPAPTVQQAAAPAPAPAPPAPPLNFTRPLVVCTAERPPMSFCNATTPPEQYTGLSTEFFRATAAEMGWVEGPDYAFRCLERTTQEIVDDVQAATCDIGTASIAISAERLDAGIRYALPYFSDSVGLAAPRERAAPTGWAWTKPFTADLWLIIMATMLVWPALLFAIEAYALRDTVKPSHVVAGLQEATWRSLWALLHGETITLATLGAKIAAGCFAFLSLILSSSYTANLAAFLTLRNAGAVGSARELMGRAVSSIPAFMPRLTSEYGIIASDAKITDEGAILATLEDVAQGRLAAFMYNEIVMRYEVSRYPGCAIRMVDKVLPFDYAFPFRPDTDPALIDAFSAAQLRVLDTGLVLQLEQRFLQTESPCLDTGTTASGQISFDAVYGLWIILAAGLGLGAGIMFANRLHVRRRKRRLEAMSTVAARDAKAKPGLVDLVFTPQMSMRAARSQSRARSRNRREGDGVTSDLVEISEEEESSEPEEEAQEQGQRGAHV